MTIPSQFDGTCKDCGKDYKKGDNIDTNGNESPNKKGEMKSHWCPDGKNCQGMIQLQGSPAPNTAIIPPSTSAPVPEISSKIDIIEANYKALPEEQKQHYGIFALYKEHLKRCRDMGITNHIEAQMLFKAHVCRISS